MPNDETVLTWTVANWLTVLLMVFLGFFAFNLAGAAVVKMKARKEAA